MPIIKAEIDTDRLEGIKEKAQVTFLVGAIQNLFDWIVEHKDELTFQSYFVNPDTVQVANSQVLLKRLGTVLNNVSGQVSGYHKELDLALKQSKKPVLGGKGTRTIHFGKRGDVAVDYDNLSGKAIQAKSSFSDTPGDIDQMIKVAANQLTGERSVEETPNFGDRRIIDLTIKSPDNPWPRTSQATMFSPLTFKELTDRINKMVSTYREHIPKKPGHGYDQWKSLSPKLGAANTKRKDGYLISRTTGLFGIVAIDFVTKVRFDHPRYLDVSGKLHKMDRFVARTEMVGTSCETVIVIYWSSPV
jgi:hypothetical protein